MRNQNPHSNLSTQDAPKNRSCPKANTALGLSKTLPGVQRLEPCSPSLPLRNEDLVAHTKRKGGEF